MSFHEFPRGMSVMDGQRCVASGRPVTGNPRFWMLTFRGGAWIDAMAPNHRLRLRLVELGQSEQTIQTHLRIGAHLKVVNGKGAARRELQALAETGAR